MKNASLVSSCAVFALMGVSAPLFAQDAATPASSASNAEEVEVGDIIVTAQRRSQKLQDVPLSISAVTPRAIETSRVEDINGLSGRVPGLNGQAASDAQPRVVIRGISSGNFSIGGDTAVGVYLDDVFIGRAAGSLSNLFDVAQIEVVRGPQGTLFGRNTTAGAISIKRVQPGPDLGGYLRLGTGNFGLIETEGALNIPLTEQLSLRTSGFYRKRDGYVRNIVDGSYFGQVNSGNVHSALRYTDGPVDITATFDWERNRNSPAAYRNLLEPTASNGFYTLASDISSRDAILDRDIYMGSLKADVDLGGIGKWTTIAAYRQYRVDYNENTDGTQFAVANYHTIESQKAYSLESRLAFEAGKFQGVVGLNYFKETPRAPGSITYDEDAVCGAIAFAAVGTRIPSCAVVIPIISGGLAPGFPGQTGVVETSLAVGHFQSISGFADLTYNFTSQLSFTAGVRYNRDKKRMDVNSPPAGNALGIVLGLTRPPVSPGVQPGGLLFFATNGPVALKDSWNSVQPRFVLSYTPSRDLHLYASVSKGFTSGGFNSLAPQGGTYDPESIWSYEIGAKGRLLDGHVTYELSGYYYKYDNLQVQIEDPVALIRNAAKATGRGVELSVAGRIAEGFSVDITAAYSDPKYGHYVPHPGVNYAGNSLQQSPKFSGSIGPTWEKEFADQSSVMLTANLSYRSKQFYDDANSALLKQKGYELLDARATYTLPGGKMSVSVFGTNLTKQKYTSGFNDIIPIGAVDVIPGQPRFYGIEGKVKF